MVNCSCIPGQEVKLVVSSAFTSLFDSPKVPEIPKWEIVIKFIFYIIAFFMDVIGNTLVVSIIYLNKKMRTSTNILILNLAVSDLLVALFCMWVHLGNDIYLDWPFGPFMCKFSYFIQEIALASSVLTLTTISIERSLAILMPFKGKMSIITICGCICLNWTLSVAVAAPYLVYKEQLEVQWRDRKSVWCDETWPKFYMDCKCTIEQPGKKIYYVVQCIVMYFIPIIIMIVTYCIITITLLQRKVPGETMESIRAAQEKTRRKVNRMLVIILAVFVICWTPQQGLVLWAAVKKTGEKKPDFIEHLRYATLYIAFFNSAINPVLYGGLNENFRKGFKEAFKCLLWKERNQIYPDGFTNNTRRNQITDGLTNNTRRNPFTDGLTNNTRRNPERQDTKQSNMSPLKNQQSVPVASFSRNRSADPDGTALSISKHSYDKVQLPPVSGIRNSLQLSGNNSVVTMMNTHDENQ